MADATNMRPDERQDLAGLFSTLKRHLPIILACVVGMVVVAWGISKVLPRRYTAAAQLEYTPQEAVAGTSQPQMSDLARDAKIDAEVQTMKSLPVAVRVVEDLKLDRAQRNQMLKDGNFTNVVETLQKQLQEQQQEMDRLRE